MLPSLEPLPSTTIQTLRGVVNVVLDDMELDWAGPGNEERATDMTVVVIRRKGLGIYRVGSRMIPVKVSLRSFMLLTAGNTPSLWTYRRCDLFNLPVRRHTVHEYVQSDRSRRSLSHRSPAGHAD
jgi:hypothetical protein